MFACMINLKEKIISHTKNCGRRANISRGNTEVAQKGIRNSESNFTLKSSEMVIAELLLRDSSGVFKCTEKGSKTWYN